MQRTPSDPSASPPADIGAEAQHAPSGRRLALHLALGTCIGAAGFLSLARGVRRGRTDALDERLLLAFRRADDPTDPLGPPWFEEAVRDLTSLGGLAIIAVALLVMWLIDMVGRRVRAAQFHLVSVLLGIALVFWLKDHFARPRPDLVPHAARVLTHSFPSGHAATAALAHLSIGAFIARGCRRWRAKVLAITVAVVLSLCVGATRVYLGVHWPTDVAAGWVIGAAWAWILWALDGHLRRRGVLEPLP